VLTHMLVDRLAVKAIVLQYEVPSRQSSSHGPLD
jgi:hypothetical protein